MGFKEDIQNLFEYGHEKYLSNISIDCVIFGFHENELKVLLLKAKYAGKFALPGGFIQQQENIDIAASRVLKERTGLNKIFMRQFHVFSRADRSTKKINKQFLKNAGVKMNKSWMFERFITIGFTALVDFTLAEPVADTFSESCEWHTVHDKTELILDHNEILNEALNDLRMQLNYHPVGYNLLPDKFTMPDLQKLYETILDRKLDRRNFQRKIIGTGILKKLNETKKGVAHKAPFLYKFNVRKYQNALQGGMGFQL
jgi:8-oxo-dGTP diphosphatase